MCTDCELHVHWICSACALIVYCMGTAYALIANSMCTACALHETLYSPLLLLLLLLLEHYLPASDASTLHWWDLPMPHLLLPHLPWQDPTPQVRAWPRCDPAPRDVERLALSGQGASRPPPRPCRPPPPAPKSMCIPHVHGRLGAEARPSLYLLLRCLLWLYLLLQDGVVFSIDTIKSKARPTYQNVL